MSRIGKLSVKIPSSVSIDYINGVVTVSGNNIVLTQIIDSNFKINISDELLEVIRPDDSKNNKALHGLYRALINNMVIGVSKGFNVKLELVGVGYRVTTVGQRIDLSLGFSHNIVIELPLEIKVEAINEKGKNPILSLSSYDKQLLGMVVAKIRSFRKPEPYKGKGIRLLNEIVRRKAGKSA